METIGKQTIWSFIDNSTEANKTHNRTIRQNPGHRVESFLDLAKKVAELQFKNRDHVLLFRGQSADHLSSDGQSMLKPTLFRHIEGQPPNYPQLESRFNRLRDAEWHLVNLYEQNGFVEDTHLKRYQVLRWSILQHYEVCFTPLLDVTHSLRIAASFASHWATDIAYLFVLGVPNLSGAITASAEAGLQIVRLSSVCPPMALRPHLQEGYLLGEYPEMSSLDQKLLYSHTEVDFGHRLIAKFYFNPDDFWRGRDFPQVSKEAVYPAESSDQLCQLANQIKRSLPPI